MDAEKIQTPKQVKEFYEGFHGRICLRESLKFNRWLLKILKIKPGMRLLDIACGGGYLVAEAKKNGLACYGVDISERALGIAAQQAGQERFVASDAEHLPWRDNYFDLVTCLGSLEHFISPAKALNEMVRVAKDDASICILVPNLFSWENIKKVQKTGQAPTHGQELERFATRQQWQELLEASKLKVKRVVKYNGFPRLLEIKNGIPKIRSLRKFFGRFFIPFNLCSSFIFICEKKYE
ncbi:MAG: methyltransferase domain-containing protein [Candidatus Omnitrophica bacterium]|nr:methyltransferase domain-containing protein [Candidatus Omnitrophota bacterium]